MCRFVTVRSALKGTKFLVMPNRFLQCSSCSFYCTFAVCVVARKQLEHHTQVLAVKCSSFRNQSKNFQNFQVCENLVVGQLELCVKKMLQFEFTLVLLKLSNEQRVVFAILLMPPPFHPQSQNNLFSHAILSSFQFSSADDPSSLGFLSWHLGVIYPLPTILQTDSSARPQR